jgi:hypothetical protein
MRYLQACILGTVCPVYPRFQNPDQTEAFLSTETLIQKVREQLGTLDTQGEQAVKTAVEILENREAGAPAAQPEFKSHNITLEEYVALSRPERRRYQSDAEELNQRRKILLKLKPRLVLDFANRCRKCTLPKQAVAGPSFPFHALVTYASWRRRKIITK